MMTTHAVRPATVADIPSIGDAAGRAFMVDGLGAYLETQTIENVAFYSRFGFEMTDEFQPLKDGPTAGLMWRNPR